MGEGYEDTVSHVNAHQKVFQQKRRSVVEWVG